MEKERFYPTSSESKPLGSGESKISIEQTNGHHDDPDYIKKLEIEDKTETHRKIQETLQELNELFGAPVTLKKIPDERPKMETQDRPKPLRATRPVRDKVVKQVVKTPPGSKYSIEQEKKDAQREAVVSSLTAYENMVRRIPMFTPKEEVYYTHKYWATRDEGLREKIVNHNLRLPLSIARKYYGKLPYEDLVQFGNMGLITAVDKFDPTTQVTRPDGSKGEVRFSTYATWWIRQEISRGIADTSRNVRYPVHAHEDLNKYRRIRSEFETLNQYKPSDEEMASAMGWKVEKAIHMKSLDARDVMLSLDQPLNVGRGANTEEGSTLKELRSRKQELTPELAATQTGLVTVVSRVLERAGLREQEIDVINKRYGLGYADNMTLEALGKEYSVTRGRIDQIEEEALFKISTNPEAVRALKEILDFMQDYKIRETEID